MPKSFLPIVVVVVFFFNLLQAGKAKKKQDIEEVISFLVIILCIIWDFLKAMYFCSIHVVFNFYIFF